MEFMSEQAHILIVDDHRDIREPMARYLSKQGYRTKVAKDAADARHAIKASAIDLIILDVMMPGEDGLSLCRSLRATSTIPIILLTAMADETDRIIGLEMGADDYVTKPFSPRELTARIGSVLRRTNGKIDEHVETEIVEFDDLVIDLRCRDVRIKNIEVELTAKEFDLLACLTAAPRQVFSKDQLLRAVWDTEPEWQSASTVAEHIHRLRRKIEVDPSLPRWIQTMRGAGYRFVP